MNNDRSPNLLDSHFSESPIVLWETERGERPTDQCDCACADTRLAYSDPSSIFLQPNARYRTSTGVRVTPLTSDWHLAHQPLSKIVPVVFNEPSRQLLNYFNTPRYLEDTISAFAGWGQDILENTTRRLLVADLIAVEGAMTPRRPSAASILTAWLHVTNACNLRCTYCYLNKTAESMSLVTGQCAIDAVFRSALRHDYVGIKLKYAGGEAALKFPLILQLHKYALELAKRNQLSLDEVVLSNGTLLDTPSIEMLKANRIRLMISLDGIGEYHDAQRKYASGRGSFALVARNIDLALQYGLTPDISITVSERNLDGLPDTVKYVLDRDLPFSLNFYRENDCSMSIENLRFNEQRIIEAMLKTYRVIEENLPRRSLLGSLIDRASFLAPHDHTCGVGRDYMVIDQHGHIAKCQMEITKPVTDIRANDPLQLIRADQIGIQNKSVEEKEGCRDCEWKYWCAGGCPLSTYRATGRYDIKSPNCNIYKALYPHVVRLEGLRLLKYESVQELA